MEIRSNPRLLKSELVSVAPNVEVFRPFPLMGIKKVGPFILWDHFGPKEVAAGDSMIVPPHPHAGFQTITYLFSGVGFHKDSFAGEQYMLPGGVNWMTAGKGIVHAEQVLGDKREQGGTYEGFQIWVNLPAAFKEVDPGFEHYAPEELPVVELEGGSLRVIAGGWKDTSSPVHTYSPLFLYHASLQAGNGLEIDLPDTFEGGVYVAKGKIKGAEELDAMETSDLLQYHAGKGGMRIESLEDSELMIFGGELIREPMVSYGPFVMNKPEEIREKIEAFQSGRMGNVEL